MSTYPVSEEHPIGSERRVTIPIRNLWFLLMYAAELAKFVAHFDRRLDATADVADLLARLLALAVDRRLRRSLSRGYRPRSAVLTRVRGRVDVLHTESGFYRQRGRLACRFDELTADTPRNRYARAGLERVGRDVRDAELAHRCRSLARDLLRLGVSAERPSVWVVRREQISRHESDDRLMVSAARFALARILPDEGEGSRRAAGLDRNDILLRRIFERAIAGFYRFELHGRNGWSVTSQKSLTWPAAEVTGGMLRYLPEMRADIILDNSSHRRRLVVETKFTNILLPRQYGGMTFDSSHICQLYAYLQSQTGQGDALADEAVGILLYPTIDRPLDEAITIQGHRIRFATVDLRQQPHEIRHCLLALVQTPI